MSNQMAEQIPSTAPTTSLTAGQTGVLSFALLSAITYRDTVVSLARVNLRIREAKKPALQTVTKEQRETKKKAKEAFDALTPESKDAAIASAFRSLASASAPIAQANKAAAEAVSDKDVEAAKQLRKDRNAQFKTMDMALSMPFVQSFVTTK